MVSLLTHAVLGLAVITWIVRANPTVFARPTNGGLFSPMEIVYYVVGIASVVLGWYFNITFVREYSKAPPTRCGVSTAAGWSTSG